MENNKNNSAYINNKRIAKNTLLLYFRMLFLMAINLFTSRIILNALGIDDYGIYNVVGGFVAMFTMLSGSLSSAISRFFTFELGKNDLNKLKDVFSTSVNIQLGLSFIVIIIGEIVGLWFLNNKMNIPLGRIDAANWTLQCSLGIFVINLISIPYNAAIIAHEKMGAFAYISILDAVLKLLIVYLLLFFSCDRLKLYPVLLLFESFVIRIVYGIYSRRNFEECVYRFIYNKDIFKEMTRFAGWNFLGTSAFILNTQGVNILLNIYFGVVVNAARGVATQAGTAISQFVNSFTMAVNPQITKSYATNNTEYLHSLICRSAKFSTYLFLIIAIPLLIETPMIFKIWLKIVPDYTVIFFRLSLLGALVDSVLANSLMTAIFATGDIKKYQISVSLLGVMVFPLTWLFYELDFSPSITYVIYFVIYCIVLVVRLYLIREKIGLPIRRFLFEVLAKVIPVSILSFSFPMIILQFLPASFLRLFLVTVFSVTSSCVVICLIGLSVGERQLVFDKIKSSRLGKLI